MYTEDAPQLENQEKPVQEKQALPPRRRVRQSLSSALTVLLLIILLIGGGYGAYAWQHMKVNDLTDQKTALENNLSQKDALLKQAQDKLAKSNAASEQSTVGVKVTNAQNFKDGENYELFLDFTINNTGTKPYKFSLGDIKVKNTSTSSTLASYIIYPETFRKSTLMPLKDQTIQPGEKLTGFLQYTAGAGTESSQKAFTVSFTDSATSTTSDQAVTATVAPKP